MWRPVPDFPAYEVSEFGEVRHAGSKRPRATRVTDSGYEKLSLRRSPSETPRNVSVHGLVMAAHRPDDLAAGRADGKTIDHADRDPTNNDVANLRMATPREQSANRRVRPRTSPPPTALAVVMTRRDGTSTTFESTRHAARETGVPQASISRCARGKYKTAGGCTWRFCDVDSTDTTTKDTSDDTTAVERWRAIDVPCDVRKIEVSDAGRVRFRVGGGVVVKETADLPTEQGYPVVYVADKVHRVHRLVARAFLGTPSHPSLVRVRHLDGDRLNASASNLAWTAGC